MQTTQAAQPTTKKKDSSFKSKEEYVAYLNLMRQSRGDTWFKKKIAEMEAREVTRKKAWNDARDAAFQLWKTRVDAWSNGGGFDAVVSALSLGTGKKTSGRTKFNVDGVVFEVDHNRQKCTRWDGKTFANNKKGRSGAMGLAQSVFELRGSGKPYQDARELISGLSGISNEAVQVTPEITQKLEEIRQAHLAAEERKKEDARREDPLTPEQLSYAPRRLTDQKDIDELTLIMARERSFPLEYAKRIVAEGIVYFATQRGLNADTGRVYDTNRPIVSSEVRGFETGTLVAFSSRELKEFWPHESGKGKNLHAIEKGAVVIGNWSESTKRVHLCEAVYTGLALRLLRERFGRPLQDDEAILCMAGSRRPERLLELCKKRGVEVVSAHDNDAPGRKSAADIAAWCLENQVKFTNGLPPRGEAEMSFEDGAWGRTAYSTVAKELSSKGVKFMYLPAENGRLKMLVETSDISCSIIGDVRRHESVDLRVNKITRAEDEPNRFSVKFHRKDWNELIQTKYRPRATVATGLPAPSESGTILAPYLQKLGLSKQNTAAMVASGLVYAGKFDAKDSIIWVSLNPTTGTVSGYSSVDPDTGVRKDAGATWTAGVTVGDQSVDRKVAIVTDFNDAIAEWNADSATAAVVMLSNQIPLENLRKAASGCAEIKSVLRDSDQDVQIEAALTKFGSQNGIKIQPARPRPAAPTPDW